MAEENAEKKENWRQMFFYGLAGLMGSGFLFWYFMDFESSHEASRKMNFIFATLYNIGGKWLVCGPLGALSLWMCIQAVRVRLRASDGNK